MTRPTVAQLARVRPGFRARIRRRALARGLPLAMLVKAPWRRAPLASLLFVALLHASCEKPDTAPHANGDPEFWSNSPEVCARDQVREYYCDGLLPLESALPAPPPFDNCPSNIDHHVGEFEPTPPIAVFDKSYTAYIRKRTPPGHNCCYSWCAPVEVKTLNDVLPQAGCNEALVMREEYCMPSLEGGASLPVSNLPGCPVAIRPPSGVAFSVPPAAPLDLNATAEKRSKGFDECCYAWCSAKPGGSD